MSAEIPEDAIDKAIDLMTDPPAGIHGASLRDRGAMRLFLEAIAPLIANAAYEKAAGVCDGNWICSAGIGVKRRHWLEIATEDGTHPGNAYSDAIRALKTQEKEYTEG